MPLSAHQMRALQLESGDEMYCIRVSVFPPLRREFLFGTAVLSEEPVLGIYTPQMVSC